MMTFDIEGAWRVSGGWGRFRLRFRQTLTRTSRIDETVKTRDGGTGRGEGDFVLASRAPARVSPSFRDDPCRSPLCQNFVQPDLNVKTARARTRNQRRVGQEHQPQAANLDERVRRERRPSPGLHRHVVDPHVPLAHVAQHELAVPPKLHERVLPAHLRRVALLRQVDVDLLILRGPPEHRLASRDLKRRAVPLEHSQRILRRRRPRRRRLRRRSQLAIFRSDDASLARDRLRAAGSTWSRAGLGSIASTAASASAKDGGGGVSSASVSVAFQLARSPPATVAPTISSDRRPPTRRRTGIVAGACRSRTGIPPRVWPARRPRPPGRPPRGGSRAPPPPPTASTRI